jgi:basic membrane protein A
LPFAGPIVDNEGREVVPKGQAMTDEQILTMNFLVSGVQGRIAK